MEVRDYPDPVAGPGEAVVRIRASGICGSDLNMNRAKTEADQAPAGHEVAGEIVEVGDGIDRGLVGQRVAVEVLGSGRACGECWYCRTGQYIHCPDKAPVDGGGFAEYVKRKVAGCYPLGEAMTWFEGALVEPLAVSVHGARMGDLKGGDTVAILGSGNIGLTAVTAARQLGAGKIFVTARHKQQADMALALGADGAASPEGDEFEELLLEATDGRGADLTIETVGGRSGTTLTQSVQVTRRQGKIVILGVFYGTHGIDWMTTILKEQSIQFSICYGILNGNHDFETAVEMLSSRDVELEKIVTHRYPLDQIQKGFEAAYDKSTGSIKVQIDMS
jgi:threonine dehydrogenase-like Zn-dependent dehydrogenase